MKYFYKLIIAFVLAMVVLVSGFIYFAEKRYKTPNFQISPYAETLEMSADIYFVKDNYLLQKEGLSTKVRRTDYITSIFNKLKKSPRNVRAIPALKDAVELIDFSKNDKQLNLNINKDILETSLWKSGQEDTVVYAIVNTFCTLEEFERVKINVEGRPISDYMQRETSNVFSFNDSIIYRKVDKPYDLVEAFFKYIEIRRYDLAYLLTTQSVEYEMEHTDFVERVSKLLPKGEHVSSSYKMQYDTELIDNECLVCVLVEQEHKAFRGQKKYLIKVVKMREGEFKIIDNF